MRKRLTRALKNLHKGQRGMTGLETAIILIAFVTVASVLAYSVLSAGIYSAERGKATVYQGLASAQATLQIQGSVIGLSPNLTELERVQFTVGLTLKDEKVDLSAILINYFDDEVHSEDVTWTSELAGGCTERGGENMVEADERHIVTVTLPSEATLDPYDVFKIQINPPSGATLTIRRTVPATIQKVMDLR